MSKHGTALTEGQMAEFVGAGTKALILIANQLGPDLTHNWAGNGEAMQRVFLEALAPPTEPKEMSVTETYPKEGEIFELTLDGDAVDPMGMVRSDGYDPRGWEYKGERVNGKQTRRFKLVAAGYCRNLDEVREKLAKHGEVPEGQWREAFKAVYPKPDSNGPVGVADPSWLHPGGGASFPCVGTDGNSSFHWADHGFHESWRWLVEASK